MVWDCNSKGTFKITPYAFQKFLFFANNEEGVEVSGFFILDEEDPSILRDFFLVKQECGKAHTDMTAEGLSDFISEMDEFDVPPSLCMRVWSHSHPGFAPNPSTQDQETFAEMSGKYPWFCMMIVNPADLTYTCRVATKSGPGIQQHFDIVVDMSHECESLDFNNLQDSFEKLVSISKTNVGFRTPTKYENNYDQIDWGNNSTKRDFLGESWRRTAYGLWEDGDDEEFEEHLAWKEKGVIEMTDEEFEQYERYYKMKDEMDLDDEE